jgi:hypothetical protein
MGNDNRNSSFSSSSSDNNNPQSVKLNDGMGGFDFFGFFSSDDPSSARNSRSNRCSSESLPKEGIGSFFTSGFRRRGGRGRFRCFFTSWFSA